MEGPHYPQFEAANLGNKEVQEAKEQAMRQSSMTSNPLPATTPETSTMVSRTTGTLEESKIDKPKKETEVVITVRKKEAESEVDASVYTPAMLTGGSLLGGGIGSYTGLSAAMPHREAAAASLKAQQMLEPHYQAILQEMEAARSGGAKIPKGNFERSARAYERAYKGAPDAILDGVKGRVRAGRTYLSEVAAHEAAKKAARKALLKHRIIGGVGGIGAGILGATALGLFDKKASDASSHKENGYMDALFFLFR